MARMLPPRMPDDVPSHAERQVFELLRTGLPDPWTGLYSVGLSSHPGKPWAEIDFVLVGPAGVFCLEVKGGRVARLEGVWQFTNRFGAVAEKRQGPFEQAGSASAALRKHLVGRLPQLKRAAMGYGVLMPDVSFSVEGPDIEPRVLYDQRDAARAFSAYIRRLVDFWHRRIESVQQHAVATLSTSDCAAVVDEIRPDFDLRPSLHTQMDRAKAKLIRLTREQYRVLDAFGDNPRVVVRGGAGTGKTLLAVQEATSRAAGGERVLLCCYNKRLALFLRGIIDGRSRPVEVQHLHGLMGALIKEAGLIQRLPPAQEDDLFTVFYPEMCLEALVALDRLEAYDCLIVDEAQDLLLDTYADVFDALLKGNLTHGTWRFFLDPFQDIFCGTAPQALARLSGAHPAQFRLSVNCRNTAPIGVATAILSNADTDSTLIADGPEVQQYWCRDAKHQRREISKCIGRALSGGVHPSDVVVLSRHRRENSCLRDGLLDVAYPLVDDEASSRSRGDVIRFSTVAGFKGLESDAVMLADVDELNASSALLSLYVGASRARVLLAVFLDENLKDAYNDHAVVYGQRLAARVKPPSSEPVW